MKEESRIDQKVEEITNQRLDDLQLEINTIVSKELSKLSKKAVREGKIAGIIMSLGAVLFFILGMCCNCNFM